MKKKQMVVASAILFGAVVFTASPVFAQTATTTQDTTTTTTTNTTTDTTAAQMKQRIEKRKADLKTKLTAAQQKRLQTRCKNAQGMLKSVTQKTTATQQNREKIYSKLLETVTTLETKLKAANVDTANLNTQLAELKTAVDTFKTDSDLYAQAVSDAAALDCQADPAAFQASITAARTALQKVRTDAALIRSITNEKVKPALVEAKKALAPQETE